MITVKELLQRPVFSHGNLIAGKGGSTRKVGWVHVLEISTSAPFTNANDLILTTGIGLKNNLETCLSYMKALIEQEACGLCIELGEFMPDVPPEMIELANTYDFPLIIFTKTVRFVDITQDIHGLLINKHHQMLKDLEVYSRNLQHISLQTTDTYPILKLLYEQLSVQVFFFSMMEECRFFPNVSQATKKELVSYYQKVDWLYEEKLTIQKIGEKKIMVQPISYFGQTLAHLCIPFAGESEYLSLLLDYTGKAISHLLFRKLYIEERKNRHHSELVESLMRGDRAHEEEILQQIGLPPMRKNGYLYLGGVVEIQHKLEEEQDSFNQDMLILLRSLFKRHHLFGLFMAKNNAIYICIVKEVISADTYPQLKKTLLHLITSFSFATVPNNVYVGFGKPKKIIGEVKESFQEAYQTLSITRFQKINPFYDELGIYQIIKGVEKEGLLQSFVHHYVGNVIAYDNKNGTELLKTLDVLLQYRGSKQIAAKKLFIHRQTLYHRLERLEELLGENYLDSENRLCIEMALRIIDMQGGKDNFSYSMSYKE
ncbi:MAG: PucR family transcriptional regulator [Bacillaceae bacterium]